MVRYYTRELAARVSAFFARDLELFAYPRWEPSAGQPTSMPLPGPALSDVAAGTGRARCVCGSGNHTFEPEHMPAYDSNTSYGG